MRLTRKNYYTTEANQKYWSASFVKAAMKCPAAAIAEARGEWSRPASTALLVGSYVDSYIEGTLGKFVSEHPEIKRRDGALKAEYVKADEMIGRMTADDVFMSFMKGQKQKIVTGDIGGIKFKGKLDIYRKGERIVDLKTVRDMEPVYREGQGRISFAEAWNWPLQMAIYQRLEGHGLPCYLAVVTKEDPPDLALIQIPQHMMDAEMELLMERLPKLDAMRRGDIEPERCEHCEYCRATKKLTGPKMLEEFIEYE